MVAEQRETVQRIDADTMDIASNVSGAQRELLKYYASISSNRWLMLKVFGVLIVFVSSMSFFTYLKTNYQLPVFGIHLGFWMNIYAGPCIIYRTLELIITNSNTLGINYPTGIALTPVPHTLPPGRFVFELLECRFPPRWVCPSSTSPTVHVRRAMGA